MAMQEKGSSQGYYQRFPVLSWLGILLCFVLFPAGLINLGLDQLFKTRAANNREEIESKMEQALKTVDKFSDNEYFAHFLLLDINQTLLSSQQPHKTFQKLKTSLQKRYPDTFTFVYWDEKGELIKELSDEASFGYIIKKTWQLLKKASDLLGRWDENNEQVNLGTLDDVDKEAKILRNFLGKLLVIYQLRYPWLSGQLGRPLQTAPPGTRSRIWYRINDKFGFLCFINDRFIRSKAGTEYALAVLRKELPEFVVHLSDYPASESFFPPADSAKAPKLVQALSRFENMSPAKFEEFADILVGCQMVGQSRRAVCYCSADLLFSPSRERLHYLGKAARVGLPMLFLLMVWFKTRRPGLASIRLKLIVIFLYAGGMPLLIMGSIGLEYLDQKKQQLIYEAQTRGINILYGIDRNFQIFLEDHALYLSGLVNRYNKQHKLEILRPETLKRMRDEILTTARPESIQLYNEKGQNLVEDSKRTIFSDYTITSQIALEILNSLGRTVGQKNESFAMTDKLGINSVSKKREISFLSLGTHELYFFFEFLGVPENYQNLAMLQLFWRKEKLQRTFFERFHAENLADYLTGGTHIIAYYPNDDLIFSNHPDKERLKSFCQNAYNNQIIRKPGLPLETGNYSAVALRGLNLDKLCLLYLMPLTRIESQLADLQMQMAGLAAIFLLLTFMMFRFLASQFIAPVAEIKNAIDSIDRRDFSYRLTIDSSREFKELAHTFNSTLETLKDLETARIVQENLFPARETDLGSLRLVASSQPFSRIGGDYYDFFSATDKALGVFIGDVSGHGISAALIMAMAKATMIHERLNFAGIDKLINAIDQTIFLNRKSGTREYMTGLFLMIDSDTGDCQLINRGHCMPILIKRDGCSSEHVQSGGLPLGYNAPERNQVVTFRLSPGETLCLYTDGMAEVLGSNGVALGYEGLKQMLLECWSDQIDTFRQLLLQSHKNWAKRQDDDQTVILIKRDK
ncbi:MAG: hypothetical protein CVV41_11965 [Candidatus Riflebacteria bacterium HGW-Riflebacteria-1]|jgi:serine phosphatase RsbU (regulator of sigma subunit)|nr:MAG: hypothetical protein CVV41_11965 [Candidatus Riflebacteria bacterium HGW-Riflebacteria-1]